MTRVSTRGSSKEVVIKGAGASCQFFKLGQEGKYRVYHNQYSNNTVALNKHQHREARIHQNCHCIAPVLQLFQSLTTSCSRQDHDKRRHLSHKFCMTAAGEFKWNGSINGTKAVTVSTLRLTIIQLENNVPSPFMHPNWASHR